VVSPRLCREPFFLLRSVVVDTTEELVRESPAWSERRVELLALAADPDDPDETPRTRRPCSAPPPGGVSRGSKPPAGSTSSTAAPSGGRGVARRPGGG